MRHRRTFIAFSGIFSAVLWLNPLANSATTPKLGGTCTKSQLGKTTTTLICSRSGTISRWTLRKTVATTKRPSTPAPTASGPSTVEVNSLVLGRAPSAARVALTITCSGLSSNPGQVTRELAFGPQNGTDQTTFELVAPSTANPSGSTCQGNVVQSGGESTALLVLVNGRTAAGPSGGGPLVVPPFTADSGFVLTLVRQFSEVVPTPSTLPAVPPTGSTPATPSTLAPASPTSSIPNPLAPQVRLVVSGTAAAFVAGADVKITCTPPAGVAAFQTSATRILNGATFIPSVVLTPANGSALATQCQVESTLVANSGVAAIRATASLNGTQFAGPTIGALVNTPVFAAGSPFTVVLEYVVGDPSPTTVAPTTTTPSATTSTTVAPSSTTIAQGSTPSTKSNLVVTVTGQTPNAVRGYLVETTCTNAVVAGVLQASTTFSSTFGTAGGQTVFDFGQQPGTTCRMTASTLGTGAGRFTILVNGTASGAGVGTASSPSFPASALFTSQLTVAY